MPRKTPTPSDFGLVLRELRQAHGKQTVYLAGELGVIGQLVSNVENGHVALMAKDHLPRIRKALNLTVIEYARLRRARVMTLLDLALRWELGAQPIAKMKAIIAISRARGIGKARTVRVRPVRRKAR